MRIHTRSTAIEIPRVSLFENGRTFNLCSGTEKGGFLRIVILDRDGSYGQEIKMRESKTEI